MDHAQAERRILKTTRAYLIAGGNRDRAVEQLESEGIPSVAARLAADLVPIAFGWALLKKMGLRKFPSVFELPDYQQSVKVADSHVFTAALVVAVGVFDEGYTDIFSKDVVSMLVSQSAEVDAVNKALNAEPDLDLSEACISSQLLGYSIEDFRDNA